MGARGGKGSSGMGSTLGALVRGVIELEKGDQLYFMVGQAGMDACPKVRNIYLNIKTNKILIWLILFTSRDELNPILFEF